MGQDREDRKGSAPEVAIGRALPATTGDPASGPTSETARDEVAVAEEEAHAALLRDRLRERRHHREIAEARYEERRILVWEILAAGIVLVIVIIRQLWLQ